MQPAELVFSKLLFKAPGEILLFNENSLHLFHSLSQISSTFPAVFFHQHQQSIPIVRGTKKKYQ